MLCSIFPRRLARTRSAAVIALSIIVAALASAATASARSLATVNRNRTDSVQLSATVPLPALASGADVVVTFGTLPLRVPADATKRHGKVLSFAGGKRAVGLARLRIDLRHGRVALRAQGLVLPMVAGPIALRVGTDDASGCTMLRAVPLRTRRKSSVERFGLATDVGACVLADAPGASPGTLIADVPTTVEFSVDVPAEVDAGSVQVRRLDASGKPAGPALCAIAAGATECDATLTETGSGHVAVVVQATAKGSAITSPATTLVVAPPATEADDAIVSSVQRQAQSLWNDAKGRLGDSLDARMATLAAVRRLDGVDGAALSADGNDLVFRFTSGILGELLLSTRFDGVAAQTSGQVLRDGARTAATRGDIATRGDTAVGGDTAAASNACDVTRRLIGNTKALIFDPGFFTVSEAPAIAAQLRASCLHFDVEVLDGAKASVAALADLDGRSTLVLDTHGNVDWNNRVVFATADFYDAVAATYRRLFQKQLLIAGSIDDPNGAARAVVTSDYVRSLQVNIPDGIVWGGFCWSLANQSLARAFQKKGSLKYFGFDRRVSTDFAAQAGTGLFTGLVPRFQTTGDAEDAISPKTDPYLLRPVSGGAGRGIFNPLKPGPAHFVSTTDGRDLAYVGVANLTPAAGFVTPGGEEGVTVSVERAESCTFHYHWHSSATVGDLANTEGTDDFDSDQATATYTAHPDVLQGTDTLQVDVHSPAAAGDADTLVATACGSVSVNGQPQSAPTTLEIVFDGQGTWSQAPPPINGDATFSASVNWHAVYHLTLPDFQPNSVQNAGPGTTVTGNSSISGKNTTPCSGPIVVNTSHGQGPPAAQAQTPFLIPLPAPQQTKRMAIDVMGGYDYRLCDGEYNIGEGNWAPGSPDLPSYAGAPFFAVFTFDRNAFVTAPHTQQIPVGVTQDDVSGLAHVSWQGTVTLTSMP